MNVSYLKYKFKMGILKSISLKSSFIQTDDLKNHDISYILTQSMCIV